MCIKFKWVLLGGSVVNRILFNQTKHATKLEFAIAIAILFLINFFSFFKYHNYCRLIICTLNQRAEKFLIDKFVLVMRKWWCVHVFVKSVNYAWSCSVFWQYLLRLELDYDLLWKNRQHGREPIVTLSLYSGKFEIMFWTIFFTAQILIRTIFYWERFLSAQFFNGTIFNRTLFNGTFF